MEMKVIGKSACGGFGFIFNTSYLFLYENLSCSATFTICWKLIIAEKLL